MHAWLQFSKTAGDYYLGTGVDPKDLTLLQTSLRGIIIFVFTLALVRFSARRLLARRTVFDSIFLVVLGAMLARAINGSADFFTTLGAGVILVVFHRLLAVLSFYSHGFGDLIKGPEQVVVRDGQPIHSTLRNNQISQHDLMEDLRLALHTDDLAKVQTARFERSGDISFVPRENAKD
ncbi:MAG: DUF421 domain-containing protein [Verrucomicrobiota bacterium]|nr:DUF421 domain-containing protein [Verrucomicrobiota bacterium]